MDVRIREMRASKGEDRTTLMEQTNLILSSFSTGLNSLLSDSTKMYTLASTVALCAAGVYVARNTTRVAGNLAERALSKPPLVRETSKWSLLGAATGTSNRGML